MSSCKPGIPLSALKTIPGGQISEFSRELSNFWFVFCPWCSSLFRGDNGELIFQSSAVRGFSRWIMTMMVYLFICKVCIKTKHREDICHFLITVAWGMTATRNSHATAYNQLISLLWQINDRGRIILIYLCQYLAWFALRNTSNEKQRPKRKNRINPHRRSCCCCCRLSNHNCGKGNIEVAASLIQELLSGTTPIFSISKF